MEVGPLSKPHSTEGTACLGRPIRRGRQGSDFRDSSGYRMVIALRRGPMRCESSPKSAYAGVSVLE